VQQNEAVCGVNGAATGRSPDWPPPRATLVRQEHFTGRDLVGTRSPSMITSPRTDTLRLFRVVLIVVVAIVGCAAGGIQLDHEIELDGPDGKKVWKLEPDQEKVELEDAYAQDLYKFRYRHGAITFEDSTGRQVEILPSPGSTSDLHLRDRDTEKLLYSLQREPDGDYRLEDGDETVVYRLKQRDYGFKIVDPRDRELKVRSRPGKISIRERGRTKLSTRDPISPLAASCFCFEALPIELRAGLALGVLHWKLDEGPDQPPQGD
jgi:hypothetical protein